jgi:hypothetical protein
MAIGCSKIPLELWQFLAEIVWTILASSKRYMVLSDNITCLRRWSVEFRYYYLSSYGRIELISCTIFNGIVDNPFIHDLPLFRSSICRIVGWAQILLCLIFSGDGNIVAHEFRGW